MHDHCRAPRISSRAIFTPPCRLSSRRATTSHVKTSCARRKTCATSKLSHAAAGDQGEHQPDRTMRFNGCRLLYSGAQMGAFSAVNLIISLALILPGLAVSVRRLHDIDRTGWWLLLWLRRLCIDLLGMPAGHIPAKIGSDRTLAA